MKLKVRAVQIQKTLRGWLQREGLCFRSLTATECESLKGSLRASEKDWGEALSYEVSGITVPHAIEAVMEALKSLKIERIVVWLGDPDQPLVIDLFLSDFNKVLENSTRMGGVLSLTTADCRGRATIVLPERDDDFLVSGAGLFESLVEYVQRRCPRGCVFRGN